MKKGKRKQETPVQDVNAEFKNKCACIQSIGNNAVYVDTSCSKAHMIRGVFCVTKKECRGCSGGETIEKQ